VKRIEAAQHEMNERVRAVVERDRRRRAGFDPAVRVSWVEPYSLRQKEPSDAI
jgi:hypothetical protein